MSEIRVPRTDIERDERPPDTERSSREAQRRATTTVRRYCTHAKLDRLVTLTLAEETSLEDRQRVVRLVQRFFSGLRIKLPKLRYVYVLELHPGGHGYHVHIAVNQWIDREVIRSCWPHGFIDVRRITTKAKGNQRQQSRLAARYLAKYACKAEDEGRSAGRHRYERSQGDNPPEIRIEADSWPEVEAWLRAKIRGPITFSWRSSSEDEEWKGPPTLVLWE